MSDDIENLLHGDAECGTLEVRRMSLLKLMED
jgi:hypothetical protein